MTTSDALDYAAAALNDCRRVATTTGNTTLAGTLGEARDRIIHLQGQLNVPRETIPSLETRNSKLETT